MARYDRDRSPDYTYSGGSGTPFRMGSPGHTTFFPPPNRSQKRLEYESQGPYLGPPPGSKLQVPGGGPRGRPRSQPPPRGGAYYEYYEEEGYYRDSSRRRHHHQHHYHHHHSRDRSPITRAREALGKTFTDSNTGIGVGVLGALVGGLAAHEAAEATAASSSSSSNSTSRRHHNGLPHGTGADYDPGREAQRRRQNQILSTVVGATIGALGANAVEKRLEVHRERDRIKQERWEQKWGKVSSSRGIPGGGGEVRSRALLGPGGGGGGGGGDGGAPLPGAAAFPNDDPIPTHGLAAEYYMSGGNGDNGVVVEEKREVITRPRSGGAGWRDRDRGFDDDDRRRRRSRGRGSGSRGRGLEREVDPDARSWRDVADWVYDDRDRQNGRGRRSDDDYRR